MVQTNVMELTGRTFSLAALMVFCVGILGSAYYTLNVQHISIILKNKDNNNYNTGVKYNPPGDRSHAKYDPPGIAPCGEVCSYTGIVVKEDGKYYPELQKQIDCNQIMKRMAYTNHTIVYPPPKKPPGDLMEEFTMGGVMPIQYQYLSDGLTENRVKQIKASVIQNYISRLQKGENINNYYQRGVCVQDTLKNYTENIKGLNGVVIGTVNPWLESIMLGYGAKHVTTLEYQKLAYEMSQLDAYTPTVFAEMHLRGQLKEFDFGATFSSLEHSGLGRYTDPLNPYGDLEAMAQAWCMIKPGGLFAVGVPVSRKKRGSLVWNAHRIYGTDRLQHITANWEVLQKVDCVDSFHHGFIVLRKRSATV